MAGLTDLIIPGGVLDAAEVADNFNALKSAVNGLRDESFEPGSINSRHLLDQAASTPNLPFKSMYRTEFGETNLFNPGALTQMVKLSSSNPSLPLYGEAAIVFVFAELEVYNTAVDAAVIATMGANDMYEIRLEFAQGFGVPGAWSSYINTTTRYITPGSAAVPAETGNVTLFGIAKVAAPYTVFDARVTAGSFTYAGGAGSANGRCKGAISALLVSR
jgi:hypothetical protein